MQLAPGAKLVDVRTRAEWDWVGRVPGAVEIEWMLYPGNEPNAQLPGPVQAPGRSGSAGDVPVPQRCPLNAAASLAAASGYTNAYNILEGFEGDKGRQRTPQQVGGWRHAGLPWIQG